MNPRSIEGLKLYRSWPAVEALRRASTETCFGPRVYRVKGSGLRVKRSGFRVSGFRNSYHNNKDTTSKP